MEKKKLQFLDYSRSCYKLIIFLKIVVGPRFRAQAQQVGGSSPRSPRQ